MLKQEFEMTIDKQGFSLIEVLIAIAVFSPILAHSEEIIL